MESIYLCNTINELRHSLAKAIVSTSPRFARKTLRSLKVTVRQPNCFELAAEMPVFLRRFSVTGCSGLRAVQSRSCGRPIGRVVIQSVVWPSPQAQLLCRPGRVAGRSGHALSCRVRGSRRPPSWLRNLGSSARLRGVRSRAGALGDHGLDSEIPPTNRCVSDAFTATLGG